MTIPTWLFWCLVIPAGLFYLLIALVIMFFICATLIWLIGNIFWKHEDEEN